MRKLAFVLVAFVAGCGGGGSTQVNTTSTPPAGGGTDGGVGTPTPGDGGGGMPGGGGGGSGGTAGGGGAGGGSGGGGSGGGGSGGGGGGGTIGTPCSSTPTMFASEVVVGAADADYLYGFAGQRLVRIPLGGGMPQTVVGGINTSVDSNVSVDDQYVYWLTGGGATQSLIRTPKAGGMPVNLGSASGPAVDYAYTVGDPIYFIDNQGVGDQRIDSMPANGGTASPVVHAMQGLLLAANSTQVIYMTPDDNLRIHVLPTTSSPTAHSPGYIDADDHYVYLSHDGQLQRYAIADSSRAVLGDFETVSNSLLAIRAFAGRVYLLVGDPMASVRVERVESDGSGKTVVVDPASDFWTVAGDSVYYDFGGNVYRICR